METQTLDLFNPYVLLALGVVLVGLEVFVFSFIVAWFGLGLIITGLISFVYDFSGGIWQVSTASIIALVLLFSLRDKAMKRFMKEKEEIPNENFLNEEGFGFIRNGSVFYKGTYWEIQSEVDENEFKENEKVQVISASKNKATIKKIISSK